MEKKHLGLHLYVDILAFNSNLQVFWIPKYLLESADKGT